MGSSLWAHFNAFQKERLGWLNAGASPPITTVLTDGTYPLEPYEITGSGPKALKILKSIDPSTGKRTWYYVETRQPIGFDDFLDANANNIVEGVLIHTGTEGNGNTRGGSKLLRSGRGCDHHNGACGQGWGYGDRELRNALAKHASRRNGLDRSADLHAHPVGLRQGNGAFRQHTSRQYHCELQSQEINGSRGDREGDDGREWNRGV
jgi:hypothetical protein